MRKKIKKIKYNFLENHMYGMRSFLYAKNYVRFMLKKKIKKVLFRRNNSQNKICYPTILQLPITNACNLDCVMCNIHANKKKNINIEDFNDLVVNASVMKNIEAVGINGGEPFLLNNIEEYVKCLIHLPKIKKIYIISNGYFTERIIEKTKKIKDICKNNNIEFTISFSLDGVGKIHDLVRKQEGCFDNLMKTINFIKKEQDLYCDKLNFICTISKYNVEYLLELDMFCRKNELMINYNIATEHERLKNHDKYGEYSILSDRRSTLLAAEFFYQKFRETNLNKYYALFMYLRDNVHYRYCGCQYLHDAITITPEGNICYCATRSKEIGNIYSDNIEQVYFSNAEYNNQIKEEYCIHCSHYIVDLVGEAENKLLNERLINYRSAWR